MKQASRFLVSLVVAILLVSVLSPGQADASWYLNRGSGAPTPPQASKPAEPGAPNPVIPEPASGLSAQESLLLDRINQERVKAGLVPLQPDATLMDLARKKSRDIIEKGYFGHNSPTYGSPYQMERAAGIRARVMGAENLAKARDVRRAHLQFMGSPTHRANILYPDHTRVGLGIVPNGPRGVVVTELFIGL